MADQNNNEAKDDQLKSISEMFNHGNDISKSDAIKLISDHIPSWDNLTESDFEMTVLQGGFVNRLFICENKRIVSESRKEKKNDKWEESRKGEEPKKVILRLMGGKIIDKYSKDNILATHGEVIESLNYYLMNGAKLGPKIFAIFSGGRIEEYIPSRILSDDDLMDPKITAAFARKLARVHNMAPPIVKKPKDMFGIIGKIRDENLAEFMEKMGRIEIPPGLESSAQSWFNFNLSDYIDWMIETFPSMKTRVVFSLNDLNRANCIIREGAEAETMDAIDRLLLIDYEFCCYIWRGCDIGQHFYNRTVDVTKVAVKKGSADHVDFHSALSYPSEEERRYFIQNYLDEVRMLGTYELDSTIDSVENILIESEYFGILWQIFFCVWIVRDHDKWLGKGFGGPGAMFAYLGDFVKQFTERKERFLELRGRYQH